MALLFARGPGVKKIEVPKHRTAWLPVAFFLLVAAIVIRIALGSPVFFRQQRPGKDGRPFSILKFRTMIVDGDHLWAGDPKLAFSRVLAGNLSQQLQLDDVWAHPWDARAKPKNQILLVVESLGGKLGERVELKVKWRLTGNYGADILATERRTFTATTTDKTYQSYVLAINQLVTELATALDASVRTHLKI